MRTSSEETEVENLREEIRHLRALLAGREQTAELLAHTERTVAVQTDELASTREELEQQARLFDTVLSSIVDFAYTFDREGRFTYINQALLDLWQMRLEDAVGKTFFELPYPKDLAARLQAQIETVFRTGQPLRDETPYTGVAGVTGYYEYIFVPVFDKDGQVKVVAGSTRDITQRAQAEAEKEALFNTLQVERQRLTTLFQQAPAFIAVVRGPEHIFEMANPLYQQLVGHRELLGKPVREAFPEIEGQGFFEILDEVYRTGQPFTGKGMPIRFQERVDGPVREHFLDFVYQPLLEADGSVSGIFVHGIDLTERIQAEHDLYESQERVRLATEAAGLGIWTWEPDGDGVIWENGRMYEIYGLSPDDPPLTSAQFMAEIVHPDDAQAFARAIAAPVETGAPLHFVGRFYRKDGALRWIEFWGRPQPLAEGERLRVVGTAADVTDRKEAEEALQESKQSLQLAVEGAQLGTFYCEMPLDKIIWNDTCKEHFFLPPDAEIDFNVFYSRLHPDDRDPTRQAIERAMHARVPYNVEYRTVAPDGRMRWINATGQFYYTDTGEPARFDGITIDITEKKTRERSLKLLVEINDATRQMQEPEEIMLTAARILGEFLQVSRCAYASVEDDNDHFTIYGDYTNGCKSIVGRYPLTAFGSKAYGDLSAGKTYVIEDIDREIPPGEDITAYRETEIQAVICTSLVKNNKMVGLMAVHQTTPRRWTPDEVKLVEMVSERSWAIIERAQADKRLQERAQMIEALNTRLRRSMTETHHRVKNNLQVISAMIEMQIMEYRDEEAVPLEEYRQLKAHIHTLSIVHDLLSANVKEEEDAQRVSVKAVLDKLLPMLQQTAWNKNVRYSIDEAKLTSKLCISLALVLNELVTNAFKHGRSEAEVVFRVEGTQASLLVSDDGPGFPNGFTPLKAAHMGLELVESLVRADLKGRSTYTNRAEGGGSVTITFPLPPLAE